MNAPALSEVRPATSHVKPNMLISGTFVTRDIARARRMCEGILGLDCVEPEKGVLLIRESKFGKSRLVPLDPSTMRALGRYARLRDWLNKAFIPQPRTELTLMRNTAQSQDAVSGLLMGFAAAEKAERVASVLGPAGLARGFSRVVIILGHGSTSLNNPHESAHDCGACGGRRGGPNARGRTALMLAVARGHAESVDVLLAHGADPNAVDADGVTPLKAALAADQPAIVAALRRAGAR